MAFTFTDKIILVIDLNSGDIPWAYMVNPNNKKQMENAVAWGSHGARKPEIVELENKGFTLEIMNAAGGSSEGGRLSFWDCKILKDDVCVMIGIASDLLISLIRSCDFKNGVCQTPVMLFRNELGVGCVHEGMQLYQDILAEHAKRADIESRKTKKWRPGYVYGTLTKMDVYLGDVYVPFHTTVTNDHWDYTLNFVKNKDQLVHVVSRVDRMPDQAESYADYFEKVRKNIRKRITEEHKDNDCSPVWIFYEIAAAEATTSFRYGSRGITSFPARAELDQLYLEERPEHFATESAKVLTEVKDVLKNHLFQMQEKNNPMSSPGYPEKLFVSDHPRTYADITETERLLFLTLIDRAMKYRRTQCRGKCRITVTGDDGSVTWFDTADEKLLQMLFD